MRRGRGVAAVLGAMLASVLALAPAAFAVRTVRVGGTGFVIALMRGVGERLARDRADLQVVVLTSLGTSGGLAALIESEAEVAMAARRLTAEEEAKGLREAACAVTP